jgi:NUMOD3 motif
MPMLNHDQLHKLTEECNQAIAAEYRLFGWQDAPTLTPGVVRVLLPLLSEAAGCWGPEGGAPSPAASEQPLPAGPRGGDPATSSPKTGPGRKRGHTHSPETRAKMSAARRRQEYAKRHGGQEAEAAASANGFPPAT